MLDKEIEKNRYDKRANIALKSFSYIKDFKLGSSSIPLHLRHPYTFYEELIIDTVKPDFKVLELGSGAGEFTGVLLNTNANVIASDISEKSLELLKLRYQHSTNLTVCQCDMENPPFSDLYFDVVVAAGSLSYGDNRIVLSQILRILKPGGYFICVDSLNHNLIYRLNRFLHYLRGNRSRSTLARMPTINLINQYIYAMGGPFIIRFFGGFSWFISPISRLGGGWWSDFSNFYDRVFNVQKSAFKFVFLVKKKGLHD